MIDLKKHLRKFYIALGIAIGVSIIFLIWFFHNQPFSKNMENWGVFGDYVGGVIGTIIAAANLYIFIEITKLIAERDEKSNEKQIEIQKKIVLSEMKGDMIREISKEITHFYKLSLSNDKNYVLEASKSVVEINNFVDTNQHLFECLKGETTLKEIFHDLMTITEKYNNIQSPKNHEELVAVAETFINYKTAFIKKLQEDLLNGLE